MSKINQAPPSINLSFFLLIFFSILFLIVSFHISSKKQSFTKSTRAQKAQKTTITSSNITKSQPIPAAAQITSDKLEKYLTVEAALLGLTDHYSLYFKDLSNNTEISTDSTRAWIPASIIKSFVLIETFRQRRLGIIDFDQTITIKSENVVSTALETDDYPRLRTGVTATIRQLIYAMITQSDNTAYNTLLDILDRRNIVSSLRTIGITQTVVGEKLNLDDQQYQQDLKVEGRQQNTTTAKDVSTFFNLLFANKIPDSEEILAIFKKQKFNNMIPALLPSNVDVAHKTGVWDPLEHDGGIIYKPNDPFTFVAFTNEGDPQQVAKLARVAYEQTADSVGKNLSEAPATAFIASSRPIYYIDPAAYTAVLGAKSDNKFPAITAEDLGITSSDFTINSSQINIIKNPLINRNSIFYPLKRLIESQNIAIAKTTQQKMLAYLQQSKNRLAEAKVLGQSNNIKGVQDAIIESESDLKAATVLAKKEPNNAGLFLLIKQISDLHYSLLQKTAQQVDATQKESFIDAVYNFHKQHTKDVGSIISSAITSNPLRQQPIVGTINKVDNNRLEVKTDDGTTKTILLTNTTPIRSFESQVLENSPSLQIGSKIAVVGVVTANTTIVPQFILQRIPDQLPKHKEGVVVQIDPNKNTLKLLDASGKIQTVKINSKTVLKSSDTNVGLEGISLGSKITIFGTSQQPIPTNTIILPSGQISVSPILSSTSQRPTISPNVPSSSTSTTNTTPIAEMSLPIITSIPTIFIPQLSPSLKSLFTPLPVQGETIFPIKAVSITVINNGSGLNEKIIKNPIPIIPQVKPSSLPESTTTRPTTKPKPTVYDIQTHNGR